MSHISLDAGVVLCVVVIILALTYLTVGIISYMRASSTKKSGNCSRSVDEDSEF